MAVVVAAVVVVIPLMIVNHTATRSFPIAIKPTLAVVMRGHPNRAFIRRTGPITVVPAIPTPNHVPVTINPGIARAGSDRSDANHARRRRGSDANSD